MSELTKPEEMMRQTPRDELPYLSENVRSPETNQWFAMMVLDTFACLNGRSSPLHLRTDGEALAFRDGDHWVSFHKGQKVEFWRTIMQAYPAIRQGNWSTRRQQMLWDYFLAYAPAGRFDSRRYFETKNAVLDGLTGELDYSPDRFLKKPTVRHSTLNYDPSYKPTKAWQMWLDTMDEYQQTVRRWSVGSAITGEHGLLMTFGQTRTGKQQRVSEIVPTPQGDKRFGDLRAGDSVYGRDGKPTRVLSIHPQGVMPIYRVHFTDGSYLDTGKEHLWTLERDGRPDITRTSGELMANLPANSYRLPLAQIQGDDKTLPIPAYELGAYIADGSYGHGARITKKAGDVADYIQSIDPSLRRYDYSSNVGYFHSKVGDALSTYVRESGLSVVKSAGKFIPNEWFYKTVDIRKELLIGLMDNDGSYHYSKEGGYSRTGYSTTSERLADDVVRLVTSLGYIARKRVAKHPKGCYFIVNIRGLDFNPFRHSRYADKWSPLWRKSHRAVKSVEILPAEEAMCITVEAEDSLYVGDTRFHIVTHNSTAAEGLTQALGSGTGTFTLSQHWGQFYSQRFDGTTYLYDPDSKGSKNQNNDNYETIHMMASGDPLVMEIKGGASYVSSNYGFLELISNMPVPINFEPSLVDRVRFCLYNYVTPRGDGGLTKRLILADRQAWLNYAIEAAIAFRKEGRPELDKYQAYGWMQWLSKANQYGRLCVEEKRVLTYSEYKMRNESGLRYLLTRDTVEQMQAGIAEINRQYGGDFLREDWTKFEEELRDKTTKLF